MTEFFKSIFTSKKAIVTMIAAVVNLLIAFGVPVSEDQKQAILQVTLIFGAYVVGQGIADVGKEAKKLELDTPVDEEEDESEENNG